MVLREKLKKLFLLTSILTLVLVAGCGYKGPLKLPESETFFKRYFDERS